MHRDRSAPKGNERKVAEDRRDCYRLHVVTNCAVKPELQDPIKDPARFPWHEVSKLQLYWMDEKAMTAPTAGRNQPGIGKDAVK